MNYRSLIPFSALILAAVVLVAVPKEARSTEPMFDGDESELQDDGGLQYSEDGYGNPNCGGRCGGKPCCAIIVYPS